MTPRPSPAASTTGAVLLEPVAYPMVDESEATGRVAAVYARILDRFPMVPSLFKSFATCPVYLDLAWAQTETALDDDTFREHGRRLVEQATRVVPPHPSSEVRELLGQFVEPLSQMLLAAAGLELAVDELDGPPATPRDTGGDGDGGPGLEPERAVPSTPSLDAEIVGVVRRDLGTPIVNSIWRLAAERGHLEEAWSHLGPYVSTSAFAEHSGDLQEAATAAARSVRWQAIASPEALERAGIRDAALGMRAVVHAYLLTLPRVLTLVAANR